MPFLALCPFCPARFRLSERLVGASVRCPKCGSSFTAAPADEDLPQPSKYLLGGSQASASALSAQAPPASLTADTQNAMVVGDTLPSTPSLSATSAHEQTTVRDLRYGDSRSNGRRWLVAALVIGIGVLVSAPFWPWRSSGRAAAKFVIEEPDPNQFFLVTLDNRQMINDLGRTAWANADKEALRQGDVQIRIASVKVGTPPLRKGAAAIDLPKSLLIHVQVANAGGMPIRYHGMALITPPPSLQVDGGAPVPLRVLPKEAGIADQIERVDIPAGRRVQELLVFDLPAAKAEAIKLELPAGAFGGSGTCRFRIPQNMITSAGGS